MRRGRRDGPTNAARPGDRDHICFGNNEVTLSLGGRGPGRELIGLRKDELPARAVIPDGPRIICAPAPMMGGETAMSPIDYFMAIFAGVCIGVAGAAYVLG